MKIKFLDGTEKEFENLYGANLYGANLYGANLSEANLSRANLSEANLSRANLSEANLSRANLSEANLSRANLSEANLYGANLSRANLSGANLYGANLYGANLNEANLREAKLRGAKLRGANLYGAYLSEANLPNFAICPEKGGFKAFKALADGIIAELGIPRDAERTSSLVGRKCRASKVKVLRLQLPGGADAERGVSIYDGTVYRVGQYVTPDSYDGDVRVECTHGIHFFITRKEAEDYA